MAKRCKQVDKMVESMNSYLRINRIIDPNRLACILMSQMLLNAGAYRGFNWFYSDEQGVQRLVGSGNDEVVRSKNGFIQFY